MGPFSDLDENTITNFCLENGLRNIQLTTDESPFDPSNVIGVDISFEMDQNFPLENEDHKRISSQIAELFFSGRAEVLAYRFQSPYMHTVLLNVK